MLPFLKALVTLQKRPCWMVSQFPSIFVIQTFKSKSHLKPPFSLLTRIHSTRLKCISFQETSPRTLSTPSLIMHSVCKCLSCTR